MKAVHTSYAALYIRVSTDMQTDLSPDAQKRELIHYAREHGYLIKEEFVFMEEQGISGKHAEKRPAFQQMIATAKQKPKPFDAVLVWKFSRFARNQEESTFYKGILRKKCGIDVISISEPITEGMFGRLIELIIEWNDEYYSYNLANEVIRGMTEKALRGGYQSGPPLGYTLDPANVLQIDPEESKIVQIIFYLYVNENLSPFEIAKYLNQAGLKTSRNNNFESRSITYILANPIYIGKIRWNKTHHATHKAKSQSEWIIADSSHESIITEEIFYEAEQKLSKTKQTHIRPAATYSHWLSGIVKCSNCGKVLVAAHCGFQCCGYAKGQCLISHYISENKLTNALFQSLETILTSNAVSFITVKNEVPYNLQSILAVKLKKLTLKEKRLKDAYLNGIDTLNEYENNKKIIQKERIQIEKLIRKNDIEHNAKGKSCKNLHSNLIYSSTLLKDQTTNSVSKNKMIQNMIAKIIYNKKSYSIDIYYHLSVSFV